MAISVVSTAESSVATAGTSHLVTLPASIAAGDLVLITMDIGSTSATLNALANWSEILDESSANGLKILWYTGAGVPGNPTFTSSATTRSASIAWRITGADKTVTPTIGSTAAATSATPDPPITPAPPQNNDYLFIAMVGMAGEEADDDTWGNTPPSGYAPSPPLQKACGTVGSSLGGLITAASLVKNTAVAENPGTFGVDVSAAYRAQTITVHPANFKDNPVGRVIPMAGTTVESFVYPPSKPTGTVVIGWAGHVSESGGSRYELAVEALLPTAAWRLQDADPGAAANVLDDQFTDTNGVLLSAHTADSGDTWTQHAASVDTLQVLSNRLYTTGVAGGSIYYSSDVPADSSYVVEGRIRCVSNSFASAGILARVDTAAQTYYAIYYLGVANTWFLTKNVASGSGTVIGTYGETLSAGNDRVVQLKVDGEEISVVIDGTLRIQAFDTAITAAGRVGAYGNASTSTTGFHLDYVQARPLKTASLVDSTGNGHTGTAIGEFTLGQNGVSPADGALATSSTPEKGGYARVPGYTPFVPSTNRTFVGMARIDSTTNEGIAALMGGEGTPGEPLVHLPILEGVFAATDNDSYTQVNYTADVDTTGQFAVAVWPHSLVPARQWFHWALTVVDNGTNQALEFFVNGVSLGPGTGVPSQPSWHANAGNYLLGNRGWGSGVAAGGHAMHGKHGMQAVFDSILTAAQIRELAHAAGLLGVTGTVYFSGSRVESYVTSGTTYTDSPTGRVILQGVRTEGRSAADTRSGTVVEAGTRTESKTATDTRSGSVILRGTRTESSARTEARAGTVVLSGTRTESQAKAYTDSRSGVLLVAGSRVESRSAVDTRSGSVVLAGSATRSAAYVDTRSGVLLIAGTRTESYQPAGAVNYNDTATGTVVLAGSRIESKAATDTRTGTLVLSGTRTESTAYVVASSGVVLVTGTRTESYSTPGAITYNDTATGTVVLSGSRVESKGATDTRAGTLVLAGTRTESTTRTDSPRGTLTLAGTRTESRTATDQRSGTLVLAGARTESSTRTEARSGTLLVTGTRTESYIVLGAYNDTVTGQVTIAGTRTESHADRPSPVGTLVLQGTRTESKTHSQNVTGTVVTAGSRTEAWGKNFIDSPTGRLILRGTRVEGRAGVETPFGSIYLSGRVTESAKYVQALVGVLTVQGALGELYLPSGATFHQVRGEVRIAGLIREEHNRWDNTGDDRWPPDTDNQWPTSADGRWGDNVETERWEVDLVS